jgi:hypothetical protein
MRVHPPLILALKLALLSGTFFAHAGAPEPPYRVVVGSTNPVTGVDRTFLESAFLKRTTVWPTGEVIRPVDLAPASPVRQHFTGAVLNRTVNAVRRYWQQRIFAGRDLPPPELDTDEAVVKYVLTHEGAVGYVSSDAPVSGLKVLTVW